MQNVSAPKKLKNFFQQLRLFFDDLRFVANHIYLIGQMMQSPKEDSAYDPKTWKCGRCGATLYRNGTCPNCDRPRSY